MCSIITVSPQVQAVSVLATAVREYFFYGREIFETKRKILMEIASTCNLDSYLEESTFPTFNDLKETFWEASK